MNLRANKGVIITLTRKSSHPNLATILPQVFAQHLQQGADSKTKEPADTLVLTCPDLSYDQTQEILETIKEPDIFGNVHVMPIDARPVQLVAFDVDSTLIDGEVITMIATAVGVGELVDNITKRTMNGEFDFTSSLRKRVALLEGCPVSRLHEIHDSIPLNPGAKEIIAKLQAHGITVIMISGGFNQVTQLLAKDLNVQYCFANTLDVDEETQCLTGKTVGPIVDRQAKATHVTQVASELGIPLEHCVAVGDGANDLGMMAAAGFSIGYGHKPIIHEHADANISDNSLLVIADILGL